MVRYDIRPPQGHTRRTTWTKTCLLNSFQPSREFRKAKPVYVESSVVILTKLTWGDLQACILTIRNRYGEKNCYVHIPTSEKHQQGSQASHCPPLLSSNDDSPTIYSSWYQLSQLRNASQITNRRILESWCIWPTAFLMFPSIPSIYLLVLFHNVAPATLRPFSQHHEEAYKKNPYSWKTDL